MEEIIVYFKCRKNSDQVNQVRHKFYFKREKPRFKKIEKFGCNFLFVEVPISYQNIAAGKKEKTEKIVSAVICRLQKKSDFVINDIWYEPMLTEYLHAEQGNYPLSFLTGIYKSYFGTEQIILRDGENVSAFISAIYGELNALTIYTKEEETWTEFIEEAYRQSGLIIQCNHYIKKKESMNTCFFDFGKTEFSDYRSIPANAVYIDFAPSKQKKRVIEAKRKDIVYCTYAKFLDTSVTDRV